MFDSNNTYQREKKSLFPWTVVNRQHERTEEKKKIRSSFIFQFVLARSSFRLSLHLCFARFVSVVNVPVRVRVAETVCRVISFHFSVLYHYTKQTYADSFVLSMIIVYMCLPFYFVSMSLRIWKFVWPLIAHFLAFARYEIRKIKTINKFVKKAERGKRTLVFYSIHIHLIIYLSKYAHIQINCILSYTWKCVAFYPIYIFYVFLFYRYFFFFSYPTLFFFSVLPVSYL